jgi:hypothetical protein
MRFKEWLLSESSGQVVLMKAVQQQGADSIKKDGFQLQDRHRSVANSYKKYDGEMSDSQMYGPGLYFGIIPPGQDPKEFATKKCKDYALFWGGHVVLATIKEGSRGLITGFWPEHPMWKYCVSKERYIYDQLEALGVNKLIGYTKNDIHTSEEWGYKFYDKIDFWAHQHNSNQHIVVYNPSILQLIDQFECDTGKKKSQEDSTAKAEPTQGISPLSTGSYVKTYDRDGKVEKAIKKLDPLRSSPIKPKTKNPDWLDLDLEIGPADLEELK